MSLKIFIIAGEASGDRLGAKLMKSLKSLSKQDLKFYGIGGQLMEKEGLKSLFPISKISLMGFAEIIPHILDLRQLILNTIGAANSLQPNIVITIDSPSFCFRVIKHIKRIKSAKFIHYVSPSVWAYKEDRVNFIAKYYDLVLSVLPFESEYYKNVPVSCQYIGHPISEDGWDEKIDKAKFKAKHKISSTSKILGVMAGSRKSEVQNLLPIFIEGINSFTRFHKNITVIFPTINEEISKYIENNVKELNCPVKIIKTFKLSEKDRTHTLKSFDAAIVKSGTSSLELTFAKVPMIVAYKMHFITFLIVKYYFKLFKKLNFASISNILLKKEAIPEYIQNNCTPDNITTGLKLLFDKKFTKNQVNEYEKAINLLSTPDKTSPSEKAAQLILK